MLFSLPSCDIAKSIVFINKTQKDLTISLPDGKDNPYFMYNEGKNNYHLMSQGPSSRFTLYKGFGKWQKSDVVDLTDILTMSTLTIDPDTTEADLINPDFLNVKRAGLFGHKLKIILK